MAELLQRILAGPEGLDVALLEQIVNVVTVPGASQEQVRGILVYRPWELIKQHS